MRRCAGRIEPLPAEKHPTHAKFTTVLSPRARPREFRALPRKTALNERGEGHTSSGAEGAIPHTYGGGGHVQQNSDVRSRPWAGNAGEQRRRILGGRRSGRPDQGAGRG